MHSGMDYGLAITRIEQKVRYLETKMANANDERTRHFAQLDKESFELALDCLKFARNFATYEAANKTN